MGRRRCVIVGVLAWLWQAIPSTPPPTPVTPESDPRANFQYAPSTN